MTGPDLLNDLVNVLLMFRIRNYAATADISKAFLNVQLNVNDRDCCRFFWTDDPFDVNSKINVYRFRVLLFGSTASQFLLSSAIKHHVKKYNNETSASICRNIYVDDLHFTNDSENKLCNKCKNASQIMAEGGFSLRKRKSNSLKVTRSVSRSDDISSGISGNSNKVLGVPWNFVIDKISVSGIRGPTPFFYQFWS